MGLSRSNVLRMADYILSQDCERDECLRQVKEHRYILNRSQQRKMAENSIWFVALRARDGAREANKSVTELLNEVWE